MGYLKNAGGKKKMMRSCVNCYHMQGNLSQSLSNTGVFKYDEKEYEFLARCKKNGNGQLYNIVDPDKHEGDILFLQNALACHHYQSMKDRGGAEIIVTD